ncbi:MAG: hypothetical protein WA130_13115 [Candidatus Methanoperedens sp.]
MSNYGEELAYWYLRLNGFFPITDFVFHRNENLKSYADADILAIRPPNAHEMIMGEELECSPEIVSSDEISKFIFVYCEVKTGDYQVTDLFPENRMERIKYSLRRFGLDPETTITNPVTNIENLLSCTENVFFKKVLIANEKKIGVDEKALFIYLNSTILFICNRFKKYDANKYGSRMFFDSSLTQLLIHLVHNSSLVKDINNLVNPPR